MTSLSVSPNEREVSISCAFDEIRVTRCPYTDEFYHTCSTDSMVEMAPIAKKDIYEPKVTLLRRLSLYTKKA
ncbi:hypothetical protein Y032_0536g3102 [Ancylostoma ceylanicum]|uniref:Uncharacterized protein n=1 Tax=Ancylostoma ceylanicum TaxID=53326 RepID=A0A016WR47_9BILA|nr:hypothetical protein Y032_0536g3102 [Ancylostoma ceylanicum]